MSVFQSADGNPIVPGGASARRSIEIAPDAKLKVYPRGSHGMGVMHADDVNQDLPDFLQS